MCSPATAARLLCTGSLFVSVACGNPGIDVAKFDAVNAAGLAVQADVRANNGTASMEFPQLLRQFEASVLALDAGTNRGAERAAPDAYAAAAEAYTDFFRFAILERDAVQGMVLLRGANRPIAAHYGVPMENRGGGRWVNRRSAMDILTAKAETALADARQILMKATANP